MTDKIQECKANVDRLYNELNAARTELANAICAASTYQAGDIVTTKRWGECKVIRVKQGYSDVANLIVVARKKDTTWSLVEHEITIGWDLV